MTKTGVMGVRVGLHTGWAYIRGGLTYGVGLHTGWAYIRGGLTYGEYSTINNKSISVVIIANPYAFDFFS